MLIQSHSASLEMTFYTGKQFPSEYAGDAFAARYQPFAIWGREALGTMVPADEALLLVMMLTCDGTIVLDGNRIRGFTLVHL